MVARKKKVVKQSTKKKPVKKAKLPSNTRIKGSKKAVSKKATSKKKSVRRSNTRITPKKRSEAAKKGWATRKKKKRAKVAVKVGKALNQSKLVEKWKAKANQFKKQLQKIEMQRIADERKKAQIKEAEKRYEKFTEKLPQMVQKLSLIEGLNQAIAEGDLVEDEHSKMMRRLVDVYMISQDPLKKEMVPQYIEDIANDFEMEEEEVWFLFRLEYDEAAA